MLNKIVKKIDSLLCVHPFVLVCIDGRCGAGKTTLSQTLSKKLSAEVIHLDDFFLRPEQRTEQRKNEPGGNVDYERFCEEVLCHLVKNEPFSYRPYNCHTGSFDEAVQVQKNKVTIVEGSYSCHPKFYDSFHLHIFLDVEPFEQKRRIVARSKESAQTFFDKWIVLEEEYFKTFNIKDKCELVF